MREQKTKAQVKKQTNYEIISTPYPCSMAKSENPEMPEINRNLSKSKKHPVLTFYHY